MLIPLFDIDGTLININGAGRRVMTIALKEVYGIAGSIDNVNFAGKTDLAIIYETMLAAGVPTTEINEGLPELFRVMVETGSTIFFENDLTPCIGAIELIDRLDDRGDVALGLLTGNIEGTARQKLKAAGFDPARFRFGAFGSDGPERNDLGPTALQRARALLGPVMEEFSAIIIGDTPADIICGQTSHIPVMAVATGTCSMEKLAKYKPDFMVKDLSYTEEILEMLFSAKGAMNG